MIDSAAVYGRSYGWMWRCPIVGCDYRVGCHKKTTRPVGTMVNDETRAARIQAHAAFDGWRRRAGLSRSKSYRDLAETLGISRADAHMGQMDLACCRRVVEAYRDR